MLSLHIKYQNNQIELLRLVVYLSHTNRINQRQSKLFYIITFMRNKYPINDIIIINTVITHNQTIGIHNETNKIRNYEREDNLNRYLSAMSSIHYTTY